jgi:hypothetical protein
VPHDKNRVSSGALWSVQAHPRLNVLVLNGRIVIGHCRSHQSYSNLLETASLQEGVLTVDVRRVSQLRQGFGHIMNTTYLEREYLQEMLDLFQTRVSTELNRFVRKVTVWGSVGLVWTVIVGLYGMNFTHMPELSWTWEDPAVLAVVALVGIILVIFFRRHGWL